MAIRFVSASMSLSSSTNCPLCGNKLVVISVDDIELLYCKTCGLYSKSEKMYLSRDDEFHRYDQHSATVDEHYVQIMTKFVDETILPYIQKGHAIDYGAGKTGVIKQILETHNFTCQSYDPYFANDPKVLMTQYDLLIATEVVEHFQGLIAEWEKMVALVKPNGYIAIMTQFAKDELGHWWYLRDSTHYHFYQERTFQYLAERLNLTLISADKKSHAVFKKA